MFRIHASSERAPAPYPAPYPAPDIAPAPYPAPAIAPVSVCALGPAGKIIVIKKTFIHQTFCLSSNHTQVECTIFLDLFLETGLYRSCRLQ